MSGAIKFTNLSVSIGGQEIIKSLSASIQAGSITAIIGPNGSGKTTLLSALVGLRTITGKVMLGDDNIYAMPSTIRAQKMGYLPQKNEVNWNISISNLVRLGAMPYNAKGKIANETIKNAMDMTNIAHLAERKAMDLSGGELSRALFARVLAGDPEWIMLDEPMAHLDLAHQLDMVDLLKSIKDNGKSIVIIVHDLHQAAQLADNIIIMKDGLIDSEGPTSKVLNSAMLERVFGIKADITNENGALSLHNIMRN